MKKTAFTLAEVLITLGIIGIVAAMTMPSLIANYQKQVLVTQLRKSMSVLEQGFQKMLADDGVDSLADTSVWAIAIDDSNPTGDCFAMDYGSKPACAKFSDEWKKYFQIVDINKTPEYKYYWLNSKNYDDMSTDYIFKFNDGMWVRFDYLSGMSNVGILYIDVNGSKRPNMYGRDIFDFDLSKEGKLTFSGNADHCVENSTSGQDCLTRIIEKGWKMDY